MTPYQWTLAIGMIITGTLNTIFNKVQDWQHAPGKYGRDYCPGPDWSKDTGSGSGSGDANPAPCAFSHPFFQALCMFIGEALCLSVFYFMRCRGSADGAKAEPLRVNPFRFALPALCDMTATSLMYIGLLLTYASNFQMLRGSAVLFTGIISRIFLKRKLQGFHWAGMLLVLVGTALVGLDAVINPDTSASAPNPPLGNALIVLAQVARRLRRASGRPARPTRRAPRVAGGGRRAVLRGGTVHLVAECSAAPRRRPRGHLRHAHRDDAPRRLLLHPRRRGPLHLARPLRGRPRRDAAAGRRQRAARRHARRRHALHRVLQLLRRLGHKVALRRTPCAHRNPTHRPPAARAYPRAHATAPAGIVLDSVRTCSVWIFSLSVYAADPTSGHGQRFEWLQVVGFGVLLLGTLVYYEIVRLPCFSYPRPDTEPLLLPTSTTESIPPVEPLMAPSVQYPSRRT